MIRESVRGLNLIGESVRAFFPQTQCKLSVIIGGWPGVCKAGFDCLSDAGWFLSTFRHSIFKAHIRLIIITFIFSVRIFTVRGMASIKIFVNVVTDYSSI